MAWGRGVVDLAPTYADDLARLEVERKCLAILELEHVLRVRHRDFTTCNSSTGVRSQHAEGLKENGAKSQVQMYWHEHLRTRM